MNLKKCEKKVETVEETVLEISEKEFNEIVQEVLKENADRNSKSIDSAAIKLALAMETSLVMAMLHSRLFKQEEKK